MKDPKELMQEFEEMREKAELRALSTISLERPLNDMEFFKMTQIFNKYYKVEKQKAK